MFQLERKPNKVKDNRKLISMIILPTELFEKISKESLTDGRKIVNFAKMQTLPYGALS